MGYTHRFLGAHVAILAVLGCAGMPTGVAAQGEGPLLRVETVGSDSTAFNVTATVVIGPTEMILWDAMYHRGDAERVADRLAATGRRLKAIIISHPDHDHFAGAASIVERFPGTPIWMTAAALTAFRQTAARAFSGEKLGDPQDFPDSLVTPTQLPSPHLTVDGAAVEVLADRTGDAGATNSMLWIPSLRTVLAGDVVFQDVHPWLAASTEATRRQWRASLEEIADLHPASVVPGHKKERSTPNTPDAVFRMLDYLDDFDRSVEHASSADQLVRMMLDRYRLYADADLLRSSASRTIFRPHPGGADATRAREIIAEGNRVWGDARMRYDRAVFERMLAPDFHVDINGNRTSRADFIDQISTPSPNVRTTRFDASVLTVQPDGDDGWMAIVQEKVETEGTLGNGMPFHSYALWITRDGWRRVGDEWRIAYSEAVSTERWNSPPPLAEWR